MFGFLKGLSVTFGQLTKKKLTLQYPEVKPEWPERFRGIHEFIPELCIVCNQCARICPTSCISLSGSRDENKKMHIDTYDINFEICILCDLCTEVCPTESIRMTDRFELATYSRDDLYKDMHWLYENHVKHGSYQRLQEEKAKAAQEAQEQAAKEAKVEAAAKSSGEGGDA
ncbi:NuoI/complex I 23 kDa subunit family protein [Sulfoacidibacillus thermotolerans]|uniref:NuoI/complex I 23 kDa subunit family protein n=1 Tax=Sulfoacidibacillus thermotolerans TaxID=1765684 RepID=UPI000D68EAA8|nr:NADH-quinone oxidoreductase subunit I [Sulfoacidibacillus thermotolerans]